MIIIIFVPFLGKLKKEFSTAYWAHTKNVTNGIFIRYTEN
jgi:hypothetical protein